MILISMLVLGAIALVSAFVLYLTSQKFIVVEDERIEEVNNLLPQANCGGCGKAGCNDFAKACLSANETEFASLNCPVAEQGTMQKIAKILGFVATAKEPTTAVLRCNGTCENAPAKVEYNNISSCRIANLLSCGSSGCPSGCLHLGDCIKVCKFGALYLDEETGMPVVIAEKCTSCGACVNICPRGLFEIRPKNRDVYVACVNTQKGAIARKNCKAACIACGKCAKICPEIVIENNISYISDKIDVKKYGQELVDACPTKAIVMKGEVTDE